MIKDLLKAKMLGHPIHVMLVHFPIALFPTGFIFDLLAYMKQDSNLALTGYYMMGVGLGSAFASTIFGAWDFINLPNNKTVFQKAIYHALLNVAASLAYLILFSLRYKVYPEVKIPSLGEIIVNAICLIFILVGAHLGGDLILRHKIGIIEEEN